MASGTRFISGQTAIGSARIAAPNSRLALETRNGNLRSQIRGFEALHDTLNGTKFGNYSSDVISLAVVCGTRLKQALPKRVGNAAYLHQTGGVLEFRIKGETVTFEKPRRGEPVVSTDGSGLTQEAALGLFVKAPGVREVLQGILQEAIAETNRLLGN